MRLGEHPVAFSIIASSHNNCNPRSEAMNAWTSSIITKRSEENILLRRSGPSHTTP